MYGVVCVVLCQCAVCVVYCICVVCVVYMCSVVCAVCVIGVCVRESENIESESHKVNERALNSYREFGKS